MYKNKHGQTRYHTVRPARKDDNVALLKHHLAALSRRVVNKRVMPKRPGMVVPVPLAAPVVSARALRAARRR